MKNFLTIFPFIYSLGMMPFVNKTYPLVFGLPFIAAWLLSGIIVSFFCCYIMLKIDERAERNEVKKCKTN